MAALLTPRSMPAHPGPFSAQPKVSSAPMLDGESAVTAPPVSSRTAVASVISSPWATHRSFATLPLPVLSAKVAAGANNGLPLSARTAISSSSSAFSPSLSVRCFDQVSSSVHMDLTMSAAQHELRSSIGSRQPVLSEHSARPHYTPPSSNSAYNRENSRSKAENLSARSRSASNKTRVASPSDTISDLRKQLKEETSLRMELEDRCQKLEEVIRTLVSSSSNGLLFAKNTGNCPPRSHSALNQPSYANSKASFSSYLPPAPLANLNLFSTLQNVNLHETAKTVPQTLTTPRTRKPSRRSRPESPKPEEEPVVNPEVEQVDQYIREFLRTRPHFPVTIKRVADNLYDFGMRERVFCALRGSSLVVRVGGGWKSFETFMDEGANFM